MMITIITITVDERAAIADTDDNEDDDDDVCLHFAV